MSFIFSASSSFCSVQKTFKETGTRGFFKKVMNDFSFYQINKLTLTSL